jgi:branched-chain amino acid transport system permease protein
MDIVLQILIGAVLQGALYTLGAFGLSLSFGVLKILNLSHGDFLMLGGFLGFLALTYLGINPFVSALVAAMFGFFVGWLIYWGLISQIVGRSFRQMLITSVMITLGVSLIIEDTTSFLWGGGSTGIPFQLPNIEWNGMVFPLLRMTLLAGTILLTIGLHIFLTRTYVGRAVVAASMNPVGAIVVGIDTRFVGMLTFALGIALAAGTGVFYATLYSIEPFMGLELTLKYLAIIIVGGMGSLPGALLGGLIVALSEAYTTYYAGAHWSPLVAFAILILALLLRPQGLLGKAEA